MAAGGGDAFRVQALLTEAEIEVKVTHDYRSPVAHARRQEQLRAGQAAQAAQAAARADAMMEELLVEEAAEKARAAQALSQKSKKKKKKAGRAATAANEPSEALPAAAPPSPPDTEPPCSSTACTLATRLLACGRSGLSMRLWCRLCSTCTAAPVARHLYLLALMAQIRGVHASGEATVTPVAGLAAAAALAVAGLAARGTAGVGVRTVREPVAASTAGGEAAPLVVTGASKSTVRDVYI